MALNYRKLGELVRLRLGAKTAERLRLQTFVNDALQKVADKIPLDKSRSAELKTNRSTTTVAITAGKADLSTIVNGAPFINLNRIRYGEIYFSTNQYPLEWLPDGSIVILDDAIDSDFLSYWMEGNILNTKTSITGTLSFAVPFVPTLATLPPALNSALVDEIVAIAKDAMGSGWIAMPDEQIDEQSTVISQ